ncbi:MAG: hypothetical protein EOO09_11015 [Chitinophagaceae bacterium]|nr:MAG: hypothetical protein EOO09_11015 [Chitinophagaceae bacterium]
MKVKVEMQVKVRELENVMVEPSVMEGWEKWGQLFTEHFIGRTPNAARCKIRNYKKIRFRYFKKSNRVIAWCDEPLLIENKALGYTLRYQLENFEVDFSQNLTTFAGFPFFEDHGGAGKKVKNRFRSARDKAYHGSMMEFWRSVQKNSLQADGYELRRMTRTQNYEKQRVRSIYSGRNMVISVKGTAGPVSVRRTDSLAARVPVSDTIGLTDTNRLTNTIRSTDPNRLTDTIHSTDINRVVVDSSQYYERILREKDNIDTYSHHTLTADSIVIKSEGAYRLVWFSDYLFVTYKKELEDPLYLESFMERRSPTFQQSHIWLTTGDAIVVDGNGSYSPPQEVFSMSYWGWSEKIANLLPIDYQPGD